LMSITGLQKHGDLCLHVSFHERVRNMPRFRIGSFSARKFLAPHTRRTIIQTIPHTNQEHSHEPGRMDR
jgi:hypothetical protein